MNQNLGQNLIYEEKNFFERASRINYGIPLCLIILGLTGVLMLFSVSEGEFNDLVLNHIIRLLIGFCFFLFFSFISFRILRIISPPIYVSILGMLFWLYFFDTGTVSRWINIGNTSFQPSEFLKFILIITLASYYSFFGENKSKKLRYSIIPIFLITLPAFLIINQPDLGTAILIFAAGFATVFFSGLYLKWVFFGSLTVFSSIPLIINNLKPYQMKRLEVFFDPEKDPFGSGYHIIQSKIAIGSGGLDGKGFLKGTQSYLDFLPEKHTDFIFTLFSEEFGFIGSVALLILYSIIIIRILRIGAISRSILCWLFYLKRQV